MKRLLIVLLVVAALLGIAILALRSADAPATQASGSIPLPDGSWVRLAVQQSQRVEFLVKPEVGAARIEYIRNPEK